MAFGQTPLPADRQLGHGAGQRSAPRELGEVGIVLNQATRAARAALGPVAWAVLEDVLLDARHDDEGRLLAATLRLLPGPCSVPSPPGIR